MLPTRFVRPSRVLVVEDDLVTRRLLCQAIQQEPGLQLVGACGLVQDALDALARERVDLLLTDLGLPDGSGLAIIRRCREIAAHADILVITMSAEDEHVLACIEAGASGYVLKEVGHRDIVRAVLELRAGGSPISPVIARKVLSRVRGSLPVDHDSAVNDESVLTRRENTILTMIARGGTYARIAEGLGLSVGTVQTHIKHIYAKLSVHSRAEAVFEAQRRGLLSLQPSLVHTPADL